MNQTRDALTAARNALFTMTRQGTLATVLRAIDTMAYKQAADALEMVREAMIAERAGPGDCARCGVALTVANASAVFPTTCIYCANKASTPRGS